MPNKNMDYSLEIFKLTEDAAVESFYQVLRDESIYNFISRPHPLDLKEFMRFHSISDSKILFGAYIDADKKLPVGLLEVYFSEQAPPKIGYLISKSYWGHGFASQLIAWVIHELSTGEFRTTSRSLEAIVDSRNIGSIRALEKNDFVQTETILTSLKGQPTTDFIYRRDLLTPNT